MKTKVYLAMYKAKGNWVDRLVRFATRSKYSHCEIVIQTTQTEYDCYTSSPRDGGVRRKIMRLPKDKWDLVEIDLNQAKVREFYNKTINKKYDLIGAVGTVLPLPQRQSRYFCSEWIAELLDFDKPHKYSPQKLLEKILILKKSND